MQENFNDLLDIEDKIDPSEDITEIPREVRKLRTQPYDKSIIDLIGMIDRDEIVLRPDFQRNSVWDNKRASQLIESIWLSIPIPQIFVSVEEDGRWNVIDGQQRLTSLKRYYSNDFPLKGMEVIPELNGKKYTALEDKPRRLLNGGNIRIVAIHEDSHPDIKFDVFMRINQGAVQLNAQELRNCLYRGSLNDLLHSLAENREMLTILKLREPHRRFNDVEIILRYFSVSESKKHSFSDYPGVMKKFLNDFMQKNRNIKTDEASSLIDLFESNIQKVNKIFGNNAFRKWDPETDKFESRLNLSLMDCQMLAVEDYSLSEIQNARNSLLEQFKIIFIETNIEQTGPNNEYFIDCITKGTSSKLKLEYRIEFMKHQFDIVMRG